jgi:hypothetical protein
LSEERKSAFLLFSIGYLILPMMNTCSAVHDFYAADIR